MSPENARPLRELGPLLANVSGAGVVLQQVHHGLERHDRAKRSRRILSAEPADLFVLYWLIGDAGQCQVTYIVVAAALAG